jgi:predicted nucleic acid-binding Zn ribbon protein
MPIRDDDSQSLDPREFPDPDLEEGATLLPCANCLAVIHEDSQRCPRCGHYLTEEDAQRKPLWLVLVVLLCLGLILFGIWLAFDPIPMPIRK